MAPEITEIPDMTDHARMIPENVNTKATAMKKGILASLEDTRRLVMGLSGGFLSVFLPFTTGVSGSDIQHSTKGSMPLPNLPAHDCSRMPKCPVYSW